ncbi:MAG: hypothetical protein KDI68_02380 [Gammaproteobacteria bacterium]|nr:hypothetical protein [Gammaproteobacteria bacterium]
MSLRFSLLDSKDNAVTVSGCALLTCWLLMVPARAKGELPPIPIDAQDGIAEERDEMRQGVLPWLALSGQVEIEWNRQRISPWDGGGRETTTETPSNYQLGMEIRPLERLRLELLFEYDSTSAQLRADEAIGAIELEQWEFTFGKFYTPLGVYASEFINGPMIEFGETRANGLSLSYTAGTLFKPSLMIYQGEAGRNDTHRRGLDWAFGLQANISENLSLDLSYQSDLADSDERMLSDFGNRYSHKVAALGALLRLHGTAYTVTAEALAALDRFSEWQHDRDMPLAWNIELTHPLAHESLRLTWRLEGSRELQDQPRWQAGAALGWEPDEHISLTLEYLHGRYQRGLAGDDDEPDRDVSTASARITFEF